MSNIFIVSDWHFLHNREFIYKPRGFSSVEEMNEAIIENHNKIVKPEDEVYCLGDCILGGPNKLDQGLELMSQLNGKIHLVRGNHCTDKRWAAYSTLPNVVEQQNAIYLNYRKYHFYMSHFPSLTANLDDDKSLHQRTLNLCGHSHTLNPWQDINLGPIYHVEVDAHNCYPINLDYIINSFENKFLDNNVQKD